MTRCSKANYRLVLSMWREEVSVAQFGIVGRQKPPRMKCKRERASVRTEAILGTQSVSSPDPEIGTHGHVPNS